ncbi:MAG: Hsp20/alpha crystallin family protein, partial [Planctomycetota bacterium]
MVFPSDPVRFFNGLGADVGTLVDQFLDDVQAKPETWRVPVDVFQDAESVRFEIDLPGVSIENLDIQVEDGHLRIQGNR